MIDIGELDVVFLSYDEPNADENFAHLLDGVPRARRVHGVKGFDAAHRRIGEVAETDFVVTVDGDNWVVDPEFFAGRFDIAPGDRGCVFSFRARNRVNGLAYGNGGVKIWPRSMLRTLRSHENTGHAAGSVDFCWLVPYYQCNRLLSEVAAAATPYQAFRAGFREGVKLNIGVGTVAYHAHPELPRIEALHRHVGERNVERLRVWCSVGRDAANGDWAILGARMGCVMTALEGFEVARIADFDWIDGFWEAEVRPGHESASDRLESIRALGQRLRTELGLAVADLDAEASRFVKSVYVPKRKYGLMPW